ncbi:hypothetical protein [Comamonas kerstersii]|uniref:hypothetical protein n=1 Tax=Comamonas kerstersii TaxID=225992 RepID=UPI001B31A520|nr:hypothetical protein [Comamonas kerstersii]QTW17801.1 hypothetical protein H8N02_11160 [Comamonas kerstersii]
MDWSLLISILALAVAIFAAAAKVADLTDDGRKRLSSWAKTAASRTYKVSLIGYFIIALLNGILGITLFGLAQDAPSRKDVLNLMLFILNVCIGLYGINQMIDLSLKKRDKNHSNATPEIQQQP